MGQLTWDTPGLTDFELTATISWEEFGDDAAMQFLLLSVLDGNGDRIANVGFRDSWVGSQGGYQFSTDATSGAGHSGHGTLPYADTVDVGLQRTGTTTTVSWDGAVVATYASGAAAESIRVYFGASNPEQVEATFGTEAIHSLRFAGTPVPEPSTIALIGLGGGALLFRRRRSN